MVINIRISSPPPLTPPTRGGENLSQTQIGETFPPPVSLTEGETGYKR